MTPENLQTIRALADLLWLPDGLDFDWLGNDPSEPCWVIEGHTDAHNDQWMLADHPRFWIWLAAFVAHAEAEAEKRFRVVTERNDPGDIPQVWWVTADECGAADAQEFDPNDTTSRLMATAEAILDGVRAVAGDGAKGVG